MMDATTRLAAIEARAKALGWNFHLDDSCDNPRYEIEGYAAEWQLSGHGDLDIDLQAAERLLSAYELGPPVEVTINGIKYKLIPVEVDDGRSDTPE